MSDFDYIRSKLMTSEILAQLAEECAELAQAALKFRRALPQSVNPTPIDFSESEKRLREEMADVNVCIRALGYSFGDDDVMEIFGAKRTRWRERLEVAHGN